MQVKAALNGGRTRGESPTVPLTPEEIAEQAAQATALGAVAVHAHARTPAGAQTIHPDDVAAVVRAVRRRDPAVVLGTTTGLWTCSGHAERMRLVRGWPDDALPDFASVAYQEEGADEVAGLVLARGMVLESAVWSHDDVPALLASPLLHDNARVLIEPEAADPDEAVALCRDIAARLRTGGVRCPLLYHGFDATAWPVVAAARADGVQTRIGLEDTVLGPDGTPAGNASMVAAALGAHGHERRPRLR